MERNIYIHIKVVVPPCLRFTAYTGEDIVAKLRGIRTQWCSKCLQLQTWVKNANILMAMKLTIGRCQLIKLQIDHLLTHL